MAPPLVWACLAAIAVYPLAVLAASGSSISMEREVLLARGTGGTPNVIIRAPDGALIVAGSTGAAWAARVTGRGVLEWEYRDNRDERLGGPSQSQFNGAVVLGDDSTLLCGFKNLSKARVGLVTRIDKHGQLIDQRLIRPNGDQKYGFTTITQCLRWGDGIALIGRSDSLEGGNTGWLVKLDRLGNQEWEKVGPEVGGGDAIETAERDLLITIQVGQPLGVKLVRIAPNGEVVTTRVVPCTAYVLFRHAGQGETVSIAAMDWPNVTLLTLNQNLSDVAAEKVIESILTKRGYLLEDGSLMLFGSVQQGGDAFTAAISRVDTRGQRRSRYVFRPYFESDSVRDAVPLSSNEFVAVRGDHLQRERRARHCTVLDFR